MKILSATCRILVYIAFFGLIALAAGCNIGFESEPLELDSATDDVLDMDDVAADQPVDNEVDADVDPGRCNNECQAFQCCIDGDGEAACRELLTDANHCGGCGVDCAPDEICDSGICQCPSEPIPGRCGGCGEECEAGFLCDEGFCVCPQGVDDCDGDPSNGCEFPVSDDPANCGACGYACSNDATCVNGECICDQPDRLHCGAGEFEENPRCYENDKESSCGATCETMLDCKDLANVDNEQCVDFQCQYQCDDQNADCDGLAENGCEVDVEDNPDHCGTCGNVCPEPSSPSLHQVRRCDGDKEDAMCGFRCEPGWGNCDGDLSNGCETSLNAEPNCGRCGTTCSALPGVSTGSCNETAEGVAASCSISCTSGFGNCDGDPNDGCESNFSSDRFDCGSCGASCGSLQNCVGGTCQ